MKRMGLVGILAGALLVGSGTLAYHHYTAEPTITLPEAISGEPGSFLRITAHTNGKIVRWYSVDRGLQLFPVEMLRDSRSVVVTSHAPGDYRLMAVSALRGIPSDLAVVHIRIGQPVPPVPPDPPVPPVPPQPPTPIPAPGNRALLLYDGKQIGKLPREQELILYSRALREYLDSKCAVGTDGKTKEWRLWDIAVDASAESQVWQDALKRPHPTLPWIVLSNGKTGFEGALPGNLDGTLALVKKYLEN